VRRRSVATDQIHATTPHSPTHPFPLGASVFFQCVHVGNTDTSRRWVPSSPDPLLGATKKAIDELGTASAKAVEEKQVRLLLGLHAWYMCCLRMVFERTCLPCLRQHTHTSNSMASRASVLFNNFYTPSCHGTARRRHWQRLWQPSRSARTMLS
jgi:hypothetical protein